MGKQVICYIQAFDCEKTIEAAMRSVLNQTYENWLCFVLSNGNKNTPLAPNWTFDVIKSVAAGDSRFVVLNRLRNDIYMYVLMLYHLARRFPDSYICSLDADDVYQPDFFQRSVSMAEEHNLDIVACGTEIVLKRDAGASGETLLSRRALQEDLIIPAEKFTSQFPTYKPFFNEMWGKLYRASLFGPAQDYRYADRHIWFRFLSDTLFTVDTLSRCTAIGILSGTCHKFYQYERRSFNNGTNKVNVIAANKRGSQVWMVKKVEYSVYATYAAVMRFLQAHGEVDAATEEYMRAVLFGWFEDYYSRILLMTQKVEHLADLAARLVFHPGFDAVMHYRDSGAYSNLRNYERRIVFCQRLHNLILCQEAVHFQHAKIFFKNRSCSLPTCRKLDRIAGKLGETLETLLELQTQKGETKC